MQHGLKATLGLTGIRLLFGTAYQGPRHFAPSRDQLVARLNGGEYGWQLWKEVRRNSAFTSTCFSIWRRQTTFGWQGIGVLETGSSTRCRIAVAEVPVAIVANTSLRTFPNGT